MKNQLMDMGYSELDVNRAIHAGHLDVGQAIEFLSANQLAATNQDPSTDKMAMDFPPISAKTSHTTSPAPQSKADRQPGGLLNARNSLDRIEVDHVGENAQNPSAATSVVTPASNPDDDLQRAMELSRKEQDERDMAQAVHMSQQTVLSNAAPDQDPELMRAIEESLKENPSTSDRRVSWQQPNFNDVKDRVRNSLEDPVGLRNIGNTCYLNSLLQVYFHLPDFRRAIMSFRCPDTHMSDCSSVKDAQTERSTTSANSMDNMQTACTPMDDDNEFTDSNQTFDVQNPDTNKAGDVTRTSKHHAVQFVVELQKLFAAMALGNQNCVDPTGVAHAMRDSEGNPITIGAQQDASEFNHLFLDIAEQGLSSSGTEQLSPMQTSSETTAPTSDIPRLDSNESSRNIVKEMFTVMFRQEVRTNRVDREENGETDNCITMNGETNAIIVDATSANERNLHSGLDDYAFAPIEYHLDESNKEPSDSTQAGDSHPEANLQSPKPTKPMSRVAFNLGNESNRNREMPNSALKSVWFTKLPPVVVVYLQRVRFNRETSQAEKVNDRFEFQTEIALDRYLESNRTNAEHARKIVQRSKVERAKLTSLLDGYKKFPLGSSSIDDDAADGTPIDVPKLSTVETSSGHGSGSEISTKRDTPWNDEEPFFSAAKRVRTRLEYSLNPLSSTLFVSSVAKTDVMKSLETIDAVLQHDRERCDFYEKRLRALDDLESEAYRELNNVKYRLHAVLVHDGAPSGGHYWTFIRNWGTNGTEAAWMKLSDSVVSYVSEEEMFLWSAGGNGRASAYCLIYIVRPDSDRNDAEMKSIAEESKGLLPVIRVEEVEKNCADFSSQVGEISRSEELQAPS